MAAQCQHRAVARAGDFDIDLRLPRVVHGHQVFAPILDPLHRPPDVTRRERDEKILGVELAARPEAAADVILHHRDGVFRQAHQLGENPPVEERHLGGA